MKNKTYLKTQDRLPQLKRKEKQMEGDKFQKHTIQQSSNVMRSTYPFSLIT